MGIAIQGLCLDIAAYHFALYRGAMMVVISSFGTCSHCKRSLMHGWYC